MMWKMMMNRFFKESVVLNSPLSSERERKVTPWHDRRELLKRFFLLSFFLLLANSQIMAAYILIPMDDAQKNHLKAYGIAYWVLQAEVEVDWLLNYRGGSFMCKYAEPIENELRIRGVSYDIIADAQSTAILQEIADPEVNMDVAKLEKVPKIAVYSP